MPLAAGSQLGPYIVVAPLGAGGMGEVYRARDSRLDRDVALKVLPAAFAGDADRLARFEREIRTVAGLSDPHIVAVYDVGQDAGVSYFAAELVDGTDLRAQLSAGRMPVRKALDLAAQVAAGLAAAHARGVIHRDLKPENVLVSRAGHAKIADFGLAKSADADPAAPTLTEAGTIMGTVAYMSPEQAAGRPLDYRSDQFSFGSMLYEMLSARPAFRRASTAETLAAILREEPPPIAEGAPDAPAPVTWVLERCLAKAPGDRYGSTEDLAKDLARVRDRLATVSGAVAAAAPIPHRRRAAVAAIATAIAAIALGYGIGMHRAQPPFARVLRPNIDLPAGVSPAPFNEASGATLALSPDGTTVAMVGEQNGQTALYLRSLDHAETTPLAGTSGGRGPFFSPDGRWLGFWAEGRLKKLPLAGGAPSVICDAITEAGAAWMPDDTIVFSAGLGLLRVPARGGEPRALTTPDASKGEYSHVSPSRVPGAEAVLFSIKYTGEGPQASGVGMLPAGSRAWATLVAGASVPKFLAPGFLVVTRGGTLQAAPFDVGRLRVTGSFAPLEADGPPIQIDRNVSYDVSASGPGLVYTTARSMTQEREIYAIDLQGRAELLTGDRKPYWDPAVSPDGMRLAVNVWVDPRVSEIWVLDLARRAWLRLTTGTNDWQPAWKDPQTLAFVRGRDGGAAAWDEYLLPATGRGSPTLLSSFPHQIWAHAIAPDFSEVVFSSVADSTTYDLWLQPLEGHANARLLVGTPGDERTLTRGFSSDGRWLAYVSNVTGRNEIYVTEFPAGADRYPVSTNGGDQPCWSHDGRQIFYWQGNTLMAVAVRTAGGFAASAPRALFDSPIVPFGDFDLAPDGKRFYIVGSSVDHATSSIVFVSDVTAELEANVRTQ